jgi:AcrR family transcriptional regulator
VVNEYSGSGDPRRTIELLWGVTPGQRPRRGPKPRLTPDEVIAAAIAIADRDGLAGLSMRRVADELGLTAMSLYGYVPSKAELLDVMLDHVYGEFPTSTTLTGDWRADLERIAREYWALHLRHPWLLQVATSRPLPGPNLTAKYDYELRAVDGLGLTDVEMDLLVSLIEDYVHGAVRGALEAAQAPSRTGMSDQQWWDGYGPLLAEVLDPGQYPTAVRVGSAAGAEYGAAHDPSRSFEFGLKRVLDGIGTFIASTSARDS